MNGRKLLPFVVLLWSAVVLGAYYAVHKPVPPQQFAGFAATLWALFAWLGALLVGWSLGRLLLARVLADEDGRTRAALSLGFGLGALGLVTLALGAVGGLRTGVAVAVVIAALIANLARPARWFRRPALRSDGALAWFVALMLGLAFLRALAPPTAWDDLVYHLTAPSLYVQAGRIGHPLDLPYLGFPQWGEMLYTFALLLGSDRAAALLHWTFAPLTIAVLLPLVRRVAPGRGALAAALLVGTPTAALLAGYAYVEWLTMFAVTAAAYALVRFDESRERRWLALAGVAAGLAFSAKYTAAGALGGVFAVVVFWVSRLTPHGSRLTAHASRITAHLSRFALPAFLVALPWLLKNLALTGNPVYPFVFDGLHWDAWRRFWFSRPGAGLGAWELLLAPWRATVLGVEGATPFSATIGPLWLLLLPFALLVRRARAARARRTLLIALIVVAVAFAFWLAQLAYSALLVQTRLLLPIFPLLALLAASAFDGLAALNQPRLRVQWVVGVMVGVVLVLAGLEAAVTFVQANPLPVVVGAQSVAQYRRDRLGWYAVAIEEVRALDESARVLFLWEPRAYGCAPRCSPDALLDRWWHARRTSADTPEILARWRADGFTHVLLSDVGVEFIRRAGEDPLTEQDWEALAELRARLELTADYGGAYSLYQLRTP